MRVFVLAFAVASGSCSNRRNLSPGLGCSWQRCALLVLLSMILLKKSALMTRRLARGFAMMTALLIAGFALGFLWASAFGYWRLAEELPAANEGQDIQVVGVVRALPQTIERGVRFEFDVEQATARVPSHISLAWYRGRAEDETAEIQELPLHAGERWRFTVRLKRPHGNVNPQGFDYEGWLFERGIRATGYVRPPYQMSATRLDTAVWRPGYAVEMLRERIRERMQNALPIPPNGINTAGILIALAIGDQQAIAPPLWQQFAKTGVTHLMSISGLHVTMFAGLFYFWLAGCGGDRLFCLCIYPHKRQRRWVVLLRLWPTACWPDLLCPRSARFTCWAWWHWRVCLTVKWRPRACWRWPCWWC
jgi:competence protein ComEC